MPTFPGHRFILDAHELRREDARVHLVHVGGDGWTEIHLREDIAFDIDARATSINSSPLSPTRNTARSVMNNAELPRSRASGAL
ncbi:hypothetical protein [Caballeronia sp. ATUFL_F1_KS4A]|uniref:hypothetical protein n=1 Tax=Caballeronia sp. ATUFL_F1_KS4A TaxID=2921768 RepID=UPI0032ED7756